MCNDGAMQNILKFKNVSCILANCKYLGGLISHVNIVPDSNICYAFFRVTTVLHGQTLVLHAVVTNMACTELSEIQECQLHFIKLQLSGWPYHVCEPCQNVS
jgi:hypothetical protein